MLTPSQVELLLDGRGASLTLGPYRILDRLGAGGMGQVYRAEHVLMKRVVALKVMAAEPSPDAPRGRDQVTLPSLCLVPRAAFLREVQAAAQLRHPNIVMAYDATELDGLLVLVMEYVEGIDLGRLVRERGPLPTALACEYVRQAALGLQHAFERGLIHGDVKPSNLIVAGADVKVLDLGLARLANRETAVAPEGLAGTPDFMAPELTREGEAASIRSDLYSLGCTLYYLLTGDVLFPGGTPSDKLLCHRLDPAPSVRARRPDVPPEIDALLGRLLHKDPAKRFPEPLAVADALQAWLAEYNPELPSGMEPFPEAAGSLAEDLHPDGVGRDAEGAQPGWRPRAGIAMLCTAAAGLVVAGLLRWGAPMPSSEHAVAAVVPVLSQPADPVAVPVPAPRPFQVESIGVGYERLADAVAAAGDSDVLTIRGDGPFPLGPLRWPGKALTLRAAAGSRPRLQWAPSGEVAAGSSLLAADRPLVLEGLVLQRAAAGCAHLVYCDHAPVQLRDCTLAAPRGSALVVCRGAARVELLGCTLTAGTLALCVEISGEGPCTVRLKDSTLTAGDPGGAALSVWAPETGASATVRLELEGCTIRADRVAALRSLPHGAEVHARGCRFTFGHALLSLAGFPGADSWRRTVAWHGRDNVYQPREGWLQLDGAPAPVQTLGDWRILWGRPEPGSIEQAWSPAAGIVPLAAAR